MKISITCLLIIEVFFLTSCDPTYPITVTNSTTDSVSILVKPTINFRTEKHKTSTISEEFDVYVLTPNERIGVGLAIAEIDNDIPFQTIRIVHNKDTISGYNLKEIKNLFDKDIFGRLKTPYNLTIK